MERKSSIKMVRRKLVWLTVAVVIISVMMFAFVEFWVYEVMGFQQYEPIASLGMILPMTLLLFFFNRRVLRSANRTFSDLGEAINKVADGQFGTTLDLEKAGNFKEIYRNFNKMSRELQGSQALRDDFVNQFSHEFKTPVMSINGFATLMLEEELPREDRDQYLKIIASESKRLAELSRNTLLLASLEAQQMIGNKKVYALDEQLKECLILLGPRWEKKELELNVNLDPVRWLGNSEIMQQLWLNLLNNAITYTPRKGDISLTLTSGDNYLEITVKDSGCGIAEKELSQIFNQYYKGKNGSSNHGLGMGLSVVRKIVDLCEGEIYVTSRLNEGTQFRVSLPVSD